MIATSTSPRRIRFAAVENDARSRRTAIINHRKGESYWLECTITRPGARHNQGLIITKTDEEGSREKEAIKLFERNRSKNKLSTRHLLLRDFRQITKWMDYKSATWKNHALEIYHLNRAFAERSARARGSLWKKKHLMGCGITVRSIVQMRFVFELENRAHLIARVGDCRW